MLPQTSRLIKDRDFKRINAKARPIYAEGLRLKFLANGRPASRFGIVISTKVSKKATVRNRLKRQLREILRLHRPQIKSGLDLVFTINSELVGKKYAFLEQNVLKLLAKARLLL